MLVRLRERDEGSALVSVLIVMLVLTITGLALAAIVINTSSGLVGGRGTAESRAAADAGLATALADARRTGHACGMDISSTTAPRYRVTSVCSTDRVTFSVTGRGETGGMTESEAVFRYSAGATGTGGDMIFFGDTTFSNEVITHPLDDSLLNIVIPSGGFTCMAPIPANIVLAGDLQTKGNCTIKGSVVAAGVADMAVNADRIDGSLTVAGSAQNIVRGAIGGALTALGSISFSSGGTPTVGGNVSTSGDVTLANAKITGSLTLPHAKTLNMGSGTVSGGVARPDTVTPPAAPTFAKWFDYKYKLSDWQPYEGRTFTPRTLTTASSGDNTCANFNSHPATGWPSLGTHTSPTILDARACTNLSSNSGTKPVVELKSDLVLLAKSYNLTSLTFTAAPGLATPPRVWFIVEDTVDDDKVTCAGGAGDIVINGTVMSTAVTAMAYTPCTIDIDGMGNDTWKGSFYGGKFNYGGGIQFYGSPIALPGMPSSASSVPVAGNDTVGALISQRDIP